MPTIPMLIYADFVRAQARLQNRAPRFNVKLEWGKNLQFEKIEKIATYPRVSSPREKLTAKF